MRTWEERFMTQIGINTANTEKKERLITAEVESNNEESATMAELWLESLQEQVEKANKMFKIEMSVDWRIKPEIKEEKQEVKKDE